MTESSVMELFRKQTNKNLGYISLSSVLAGVNTLVRELKTLYHKNVRIVVIDATTDEDIHQIATAILKTKVPFFAWTRESSLHSWRIFAIQVVERERIKSLLL